MHAGSTRGDSAADGNAPPGSRNRTRPTREIAGTLATLLSLASVAAPEDDVRLMGAGCVRAPKNAARSHVRNGAVNGSSTSIVNQHAVTRERIALTMVGSERAIPAPQKWPPPHTAMAFGFVGENDVKRLVTRAPLDAYTTVQETTIRRHFCRYSVVGSSVPHPSRRVTCDGNIEVTVASAISVWSDGLPDGVVAARAAVLRFFL